MSPQAHFMGWFRKNGARTTDDDSKILRLLKEVAAEVAIYGAKVKKVEQDCATLRGLVNRKLGNERDGETESNKNADAFDSLRVLNKKFGI